jgi:hypothetical protein
MTARHPLWRVLALFAALSMVAAACGDDDEETASTDTTESETSESESEESTESESESESEGGGGATGEASLAGMRGSLPLLDLPSDFLERMDEIDPDLGGTYNYGAESYDAVMVITLAAITAKTDGLEYANEINEVTRNGEKCTEFAACRALAEAGTDLDYDGVSGPMEFSGNGEPTEASIAIQTFGEDNRIDTSLDEFILASAPPESDVPQVRPPAPVPATASSRSGRSSPRPAASPSSARPRSPASSWPSTRSTRTAASTARTCSCPPVTPATPRPTSPTRRSTACSARTSTPSSAPRPRA